MRVVTNNNIELKILYKSSSNVQDTISILLIKYNFNTLLRQFILSTLIVLLYVTSLAVYGIRRGVEPSTDTRICSISFIRKAKRDCSFCSFRKAKIILLYSSIRKVRKAEIILQYIDLLEHDSFIDCIQLIYQVTLYY